MRTIDRHCSVVKLKISQVLFILRFQVQAEGRGTFALEFRAASTAINGMYGTVEIRCEGRYLHHNFGILK